MAQLSDYESMCVTFFVKSRNPFLHHCLRICQTLLNHPCSHPLWLLGSFMCFLFFFSGVSHLSPSLSCALSLHSCPFCLSGKTAYMFGLHPFTSGGLTVPFTHVFAADRRHIMNNNRKNRFEGRTKKQTSGKIRTVIQRLSENSFRLVWCVFTAT